MPSRFVNQSCSCRCGKSHFAVSGKPIARFFCHCTICQSVFGTPYADVTAMWARAVVLPEDHSIEFRQYRTPPSVERGTCSSCNAPVVGFMSLGPLARVAFVASQNFAA